MKSALEVGRVRLQLLNVTNHVAQTSESCGSVQRTDNLHLPSRSPPLTLATPSKAKHRLSTLDAARSRPTHGRQYQPGQHGSRQPRWRTTRHGCSSRYFNRLSLRRNKAELGLQQSGHTINHSEVSPSQPHHSPSRSRRRQTRRL
jgi:hypothetical protein